MGYRYYAPKFDLPTSDVDAAPLVYVPINTEWQVILLSAVERLDQPIAWVDGTDTDRAEQQAYLLYQAILHAAGAANMPAIGDIKWTLQNSILDDGWIPADGAEISREANAELFALIGTDFGAGDDTTTFNLPDLRDRFPVGAGNLYGRGAYFGEAEVTLNTTQIPAHTHGQNLLNNAPARVFSTSTAGGSAAAATNTPAAQPQLQTSSAGGGQPHNNIPPAVGLNPYIFIGL